MPPSVETPRSLDANHRNGAITRRGSWNAANPVGAVRGTRAANAVGHAPSMLLTRRIRQQAGSHRFVVNAARHRDAAVPVGAVRGTRSANAVGHAPSMLLTHRIRQQAGSHRFCVRRESSERRDHSAQIIERRNPCRSRPRLRGPRIDAADPPPSRASSLPQVMCQPLGQRMPVSCTATQFNTGLFALFTTS